MTIDFTNLIQQIPSMNILCNTNKNSFVYKLEYGAIHVGKRVGSKFCFYHQTNTQHKYFGTDGHYQCVMKKENQFYLLDDATVETLSEKETENMLKKCYIVCYKLVK